MLLFQPEENQSTNEQVFQDRQYQVMAIIFLSPRRKNCLLFSSVVTVINLSNTGRFINFCHDLVRKDSNVI